MQSVDAQLVRDTCYKYIYDRCPVLAAVGPTCCRGHRLEDPCQTHIAPRVAILDVLAATGDVWPPWSPLPSK